MMIKGRLPFLSDAGELAPVDVHDPLGELPVPTLDERALFYLRAVHGTRDYTQEERSNARNVLLNSMAAEIAAQAEPTCFGTSDAIILMYAIADFLRIRSIAWRPCFW